MMDMFNIKEMVLSAIIKKGILYEGRNCDINIDVPNGDKVIKINFKADNMSLRIETLRSLFAGCAHDFLFTLLGGVLNADSGDQPLRNLSLSVSAFTLHLKSRNQS